MAATVTGRSPQDPTDVVAEAPELGRPAVARTRCRDHIWSFLDGDRV